MAKSILDGDWRYFDPIDVDINTLGIIDGQHRVEAFKYAWKQGSKSILRVRYGDYPQGDVERSRIMKCKNESQKSWTNKDYEHRLIKNGDPVMAAIENFGLTHELCQKVSKKKGNVTVTGYSSRYAQACLFGRSLKSDITHGTMPNLTKEMIDLGDQIHEECLKIKNALGYSNSGSWVEPFISAWYAIRRDRQYSKLISKIGFDNIAEGIAEYFDSNNIQGGETKKVIWEERFRNAISYVDEMLN